MVKVCHSLLEPQKTSPNAHGLNISPTSPPGHHVPCPPPRLGEGRALLIKITLLPTLTDSGLVTMTEVLWKTLTRTTGPYFLALETKVTRKRLSTTGDVNVTSLGPAGETGRPTPGPGSPRASGCLAAESCPALGLSLHFREMGLPHPSFAPKVALGIQQYHVIENALKV